MGHAGHGPASPSHPHVKIEHARCVGECGNHLAFRWNLVLVNLLVECLAEADDVFGTFFTHRSFGFRLVLVEPKPHLIKEVKPSSVNDRTAAGVIFGAEKDRGAEDAVEALDDSAVVAPVLGEAKEVEYLSSTLKTNDPAPLLNGERCYPDGNEPVLAEGQAELRVAGDVEKESSVAPRVNELRTGRSAQWNPAENERPGIVGELLLPVLPFLADEGDGLQLTKPELGDTERCQAGLER